MLIQKVPNGIEIYFVWSRNVPSLVESLSSFQKALGLIPALFQEAQATIPAVWRGKRADYKVQGHP